MNPRDPFYPFYAHDVWAEIIGVLGPDDLVALGIRRDGQMVYDWIRILAECAAKLRDTEPCDRDHCECGCECECDRDHCPDNCTSTCSLKPTGAPDAKA